MVLVMAFTAPLQVFASSLETAASARQAMGSHDAAAPMSGHHMINATQDQHCEHAGPDSSADHADHSGTAHDCGPLCSGSCGVCAHCPAGIIVFFTAPDVPGKHFSVPAQHQPSDVPPETALRPPRSFS